MSFDKAQAMRNAERHVSQGKIRAAIEEYRQVVDHDPRDVVTLNMLGDLYTKDSNKGQAIACYKKVADHYSNQGFSQKAIAVYKKIAKLDPDSAEVSGKLASLYQNKGVVSEASSHFATLAEHYLQQGRKTEALAIWKQIYLLDSNDIDTLTKACDVYLEEGQKDEAAEAFSELGARLSKVARYKEAAEAFVKAGSLKPGHLPALSGLVSARTKLGQAAEAAQDIEQMLEKDPYNREILAVLADSYIGAGDLANAEKRVIRLVEQDQARYPKLVELVDIYLSKNEASGAARCLTLAMEQLLLNGEGEEAGKWIDQILEVEPEQLGALKLKVRYYSWKRNDQGLTEALKMLDVAAVKKESLEDERYALSQLVMLLPMETDYADRLRKINEKHGYTDNLYDEVVLKGQFESQADIYAEQLATGFDFSINTSPTAYVSETLIERNGATANGHSNGNGSHTPEFEMTPVTSDGNGFEKVPSTNGFDQKAFDAEIENFAGSLNDMESSNGHTSEDVVKPLANGAVSKELETVKFYIESGYNDLAYNALNDLANVYGETPEIADLRALIATSSEPEIEIVEEPTDDIIPLVAEPCVEESAAVLSNGNGKAAFDLDDWRMELGVEEEDVQGDIGDYDTHYQMGVAYQEMGLMEEAIKEFQDAIGTIGKNDTSRRSFQCAILMGHCFIQKGMGKLALKWFNRALEAPDLNSDEKKGVWYEMAEAHELDGDTVNAAKYFEQVYAEDVDFRDVGERLQNLSVGA